MMRLGLSVMLCLAPLVAAAEGFVLKDLRQVEVDANAFVGGTYQVDQKQDATVIACVNCDDLTVIGIRLERSTDGTEGRFRSGQTTIEDLQEKCRNSDPKCQLTRLDLGGAVGWVSQYKLGPNEGSTAVLFQDGDLLTIRSLSESRNRTGTNMAAALRTIAPQIVGD